MCFAYDVSVPGMKNSRNLAEHMEISADAESGSDAENCDPRDTNLAHFRWGSSFQHVHRSSFTALHRVSPGINGDVYKYLWQHNGDDVYVAVKKLRKVTLEHAPDSETNERILHLQDRYSTKSAEDALTEIGVLSYLSMQPDCSAFLLKMLGVFTDITHVLLVTEFATGGDLFDAVGSQDMSEALIVTYIGQMLQAVAYLHSHRIGHRDISLENTLLKDGSVKVMDFGMAVCSHSPEGVPLRYFREVGKVFYRAPECYVPAQANVSIVAPLEASPGSISLCQVSPSFLCEVRLPADAVPGQPCSADVWGYAACPADVYAVGICMFILAFQSPPWAHAKLSDKRFELVHNAKEKGLESLLKVFGKESLCPDAMAILTDILQTEPSKRPAARDCVSSLWFSMQVDASNSSRVVETRA
jgi:serine/threonine protein kinase